MTGNWNCFGFSAVDDKLTRDIDSILSSYNEKNQLQHMVNIKLINYMQPHSTKAENGKIRNLLKFQVGRGGFVVMQSITHRCLAESCLTISF